MRTVILLSGGALRGDFQFGALKLLYLMGKRPSLLCGISVGAINAAKLAEGEGSIDGLEQIWRGITKQDQVYAVSPEMQNFLSNLGGTAETGWGLLIQQAKSLYVLDPLRNGPIDSSLDPNAIQDSGIALRLVTVSMQVGDTLVVDEHGNVARNGWTINPNNISVQEGPSNDPGLDLPDAVEASASAPVILAPLVRSNGEWLVDGGIRHILPTNALIEALGDGNGDLPGDIEVYAIQCSPQGVQSWVPAPDSSSTDFTQHVQLLKIVSRAYGITLDEIATRDNHDLTASARQNQVPVTFIQPQILIHDSWQVDQDSIAMSINYGFTYTADLLLGASQPSNVLGGGQTLADVTLALIRMDLEFYARVKGAGALAAGGIAQLVYEAHGYHQNPSGWAFAVFSFDDVLWAISQFSQVQALVNERIASGLPTESRVHELVEQFTDWPFATNPLPAQIHLGQDALDFGQVPFSANPALQTPPGKVVGVGNLGDVPAQVYVSVTGANANMFSIQAPGVAGPISSSTPVAVPGRSSIGITVTPKNTTVGSFSATLLISLSPSAQQGGGQVSLTATINSTPPTINIHPGMVECGPVLLGSSSGPQTLTVSNLGSQGPLSVTMGNPTDAEVAVTPPPGNFSLASGASKQFQVVLTPSTLGPKIVRIAMNSNDPAHPTTSVAVAGSGVSRIPPKRGPLYPPPGGGHIPGKGGGPPLPQRAITRAPTTSQVRSKSPPPSSSKSPTRSPPLRRVTKRPKHGA
jgi:predicted acylesterase/phospholipase RssA